MSQGHLHIHAESDVADQGPLHDHFRGSPLDGISHVTFQLEPRPLHPINEEGG